MATGRPDRDPGGEPSSPDRTGAAPGRGVSRVVIHLLVAGSHPELGDGWTVESGAAPGGKASSSWPPAARLRPRSRGWPRRSRYGC